MKTYVDTTQTTSCLEWCAGYGGISLGLKRAIPSLRTIAFGEIEAFACANLVAKMEAGLLDPAPIWTDLKTFPCERFRDRVDILVAGYPCQPFSAAGKRLGTEDPRHLWPFIQRSISIIRPRLCFFENVEGHVSLGLSTVISDLEELGYKVSWGIFSASEVGAPHQRKRVFILAYRKEQGLEGFRRFKSEFIWNDASSYGATGGEELANALRNGGREGRLVRQRTDGAESFSNGEARRDAWPSRPGEPQYGWEPPRVVGAVPAKLANFCTRDAQSGGDSAPTGGEGSGERREGEDSMPNGRSGLCGGDQGNEQQAELADTRSIARRKAGRQFQSDIVETRGWHTQTAESCTSGDQEPTGLAHTGSLGRRGGSDGDAGGLCGEIQTAGSCSGGAEAMGNAESERPRTLGAEPTGQQWEASTSSAGDAMGNAECVRLEHRREYGSVAEASRETKGDRSKSSTPSEEPINPRKGEASRSIESEYSKTQPPLGGGADGIAGGMDYAELCVSCDNRTDELRLLGNGVVPATAERAFLTLINQL